MKPAAALLAIAGGGATYGAAIGIGTSGVQALFSAAKLPLLLLGTAALCGLACHVLASFLGARLPLRGVVASTLQMHADLARLLASLAPAVAFLGLTIERPHGDELGGYPGFLGANMLAVAVAGILAHIRQARLLLATHAVHTRVAARIVIAWLATALLVGGQLAFQLRPLFGIHVSAGPPPFLLFDEPTATGARNFYEVVWQLVRHGTGSELRLAPRQR